MRTPDPTRMPTTEEHKPPASEDITSREPVLLAAFPRLAALPLPAPGTVAGRAWLAECGIADTEVSGDHLCFSRPGGRLYIQDMGSRNGTWLNGRPLPRSERVPLTDGTVLRIGRTLLVFREAFAGPKTPLPPLGKLVGPWGLGTVRAALDHLASRPELNVLIEGETGTGKELLATEVARAIRRDKKPFCAVNVTSVPPGVFEAQLFGWVKGAYSGADAAGDGLLRAHQGGTVFFDEIGELPVELQPKLLRFVENREIQPVGAKAPVKVDVAILAATNRRLTEEVEKGRFRRDLLARFYARIALPPLHARPEDIFAIAAELQSRRDTALDPESVEVEAVEYLMLQSWPANVRDLDRVLAAARPHGPRLTRAAIQVVMGAKVVPNVKQPLTREAVNRVLAECGGNKSEAARRLGVERSQLLRLLKKVAGP